MQTSADMLRLDDKRIVLVPTMGYLHDGHLSLIRTGKEHGDIVVLSIFVNPTQFGPGEDFASYPRSMERDVKLAEEAGTDLIFAPDEKELYPPGFQTYVKLEELPNHLCGISRPVHFRGVATVVTKLFIITKPHVAVFGEKDFQQLQVIRRMVKDLSFDIEIIGAPIVREPDGLAMSSRNKYLTPDQRKEALSLRQALLTAEEMLKDGVTDSKEIVKAATEIISSQPNTEIDYIKICDPETLEDEPVILGSVLMALAVKIGMTRLIDNQILSP